MKRACSVVLFFAILAWAAPARVEEGLKKITLTFARAKVSVVAEVADTDEARTRGLMYRKSLGKRSAMLFVFNESAPHSFWMHNTFIPLDIIYLDERKQVVDAFGMTPCLDRNSGNCPVYTPRAAARYAVEVNAGFVKQFGIVSGDLVTFGR